MGAHRKEKQEKKDKFIGVEKKILIKIRKAYSLAFRIALALPFFARKAKKEVYRAVPAKIHKAYSLAFRIAFALPFFARKAKKEVSS